MINSLILIITDTLGVSVLDFTCLCVIVYLFSKPICWLFKKLFRGIA